MPGDPLQSAVRFARLDAERMRLTPPSEWEREQTRYPTPEEEARDAARLWDQRKDQYPDGIKMDCLDRDEAERFRAEFRRLRPGVPVYVTWLLFRNAEER